MTIEMPSESDAAAFAMEVTTVSVAQMLRRMLTQDDHTGLRREALDAARELSGATAAWWVGPLGDGWGVLAASGTGTASESLRCLTVEPRLGRSVKTDLPEAFVLNGAEMEGAPTWEAELFAAGHRTCLTAPIRLAGSIVGEAILGFPKVTRWTTLLENSILMLFNTAAIADARLSELESLRRAQDGYAHEGVRLLRAVDAPLQLARKLAGGRTLDDALLDAMRILGCRLEVKSTEQSVGLG
ncbi:MAG: hypothetical protein Q4G46_16065, partial [Propionibacteriaceae bacterium]|nr:hypothetical protein [Propionibacteriaceae bacterium]